MQTDATLDVNLTRALNESKGLADQTTPVFRDLKVAAPMIATTNIAVGACVKMAEQRASMYTPAVTIVAA